MKKIFITVTIFLAGFLVNAQSNTASNTGRQVQQQARIHQGVHSGEITRHERKRLHREQRKIQIEKKIAKADGVVTPSEKRFLRREQNRAGRHITRQKNDLQSR